MKWRLTKVNQGYEMVKLGKQSLVFRPLNCIEKIIYNCKIKEDKKFYRYDKK
jgi:hypothetical protein